MSRSPWILVPRPVPDARFRLICLPHAGGGASAYFSWGAALAPAGIEVRGVQYPGREHRTAEPCIREAVTMVRALAAAWPEIAGPGRAVLFGHSLGALLAYELAVELGESGAGPRPEHLFVSGHAAPHLPYRPPRLHALPPPSFLREVARHFGGIPAALLEDPTAAEAITPALQADFALVERYRWNPSRGPVPVGLTAWGGDADPWTTPAELDAWRLQTTGGFVRRLFPGGHFYLRDQRDPVLASVRGQLEQLE